MSHASLSSGYHNSAVLLRGLSATRKQPRKTGNQSSGPGKRRNRPSGRPVWLLAGCGLIKTDSENQAQKRHTTLATIEF